MERYTFCTGGQDHAFSRSAQVIRTDLIAVPGTLTFYVSQT